MFDLLRNLPQARGIYLCITKGRTSGVEFVRLVHGYCNFKWNQAHQNAKFMCFLFPVSLAQMLGRLTRERGLVDIWIEDNALLSELSKWPDLGPFRSRLKIAG
jgi:hypothetical protein